MLSRDEFDRYDRQVRSLASSAAGYVSRMIDAYAGVNRDATVADVRDFAASVMDEAAAVYGQAAASAAADLYDAQVTSATPHAERAELPGAPAADAASKVARYQAGKLVNGDVAGFVRQCASYASDAVSKQANSTIIGNAKRDRKRGVRFARVPSGAETCTFCMMLASRGFVYASADSAALFGHNHRNCDCRVVASTSKDGLEGYDPDALYDTWQRFKEIDEGEGTRAEKDAAKRALLAGDVDDLPDAVAGVVKGDEMSFVEADSGNVNPDYTGLGRDYSENCQTCVVAFEARTRGYDVKAGPNYAGSMSEKVSYDTRLAWIDPETGKKPMWTIASGGGSASRTLKSLKNKIEPGGRYTHQFAWKGRKSGHIVNLDLDEQGQLRIKDNQRGYNLKYGRDERSEWVGDDAVLAYLKEVSNGKYLHVLRIDNLEFNQDVVNKILKPRRKTADGRS